MISRTGVHALSALAILANLPNGNFLGAGDIARRIGAPANYLGKLLKMLAHEGLVVSQKGKGGGFRLARDPKHISLYEIMEPVAKVSRLSGCFMGRPQCKDGEPCAAHTQWSRARDAYFAFLNTTTVSDLARDVLPRQLRALRG